MMLHVIVTDITCEEVKPVGKGYRIVFSTFKPGVRFIIEVDKEPDSKRLPAVGDKFDMRIVPEEPCWV